MGMKYYLEATDLRHEVPKETSEAVFQLMRDARAEIETLKGLLKTSEALERRLLQLYIAEDIA